MESKTETPKITMEIKMEKPKVQPKKYKKQPYCGFTHILKKILLSSGRPGIKLSPKPIKKGIPTTPMGERALLAEKILLEIKALLGEKALLEINAHLGENESLGEKALLEQQILLEEKLSCLETLYWKCCEERFCFDKKIATYKLEEDTIYTNGYANMGASLDSVVTQQPINNNHLPPREVLGRELNELPLHADKLYEVFSKSLIFREDHELKNAISNNSLDEFETKSEPDTLDRPNRTKVYFEDEIDNPVTDFEIMFKDELMACHDMFKIDEEQESVKSQDTEDGLVMNVVAKKQDVIKPTTVTLKDETKITTLNPIYTYDPISVVALPSSLSIPRAESVKGILRSKDLPRSNSARTLERVDSGSRLDKPQMNRVESLKAIDPSLLNKVLARVPQRSASFLNIPEHLVPEKPPLTKSKSMVGVLPAQDSETKLSSLPDTPIIKSNNLPRFFADSPSLPEYKGEMTLQAIQQQSAKMAKEDFSMPRYYGTVKTLEPPPVHESKSMPDLRNPTATGKVSKRLVKLRSKLKPLVIMKSSDERL